MSYKYCKQRRLFLANASKSVGLITAANLFNFNVFAQSAKPKKNIVCLFFLHTGNIPKTGNNGFQRGTFHLENNTALSKLTQVKDETIFIRGVDQGVRGRNSGGRQHEDNAGAVFTAHEVNNSNGQASDLISSDSDSGTSIDILIGKYLQKQYPETRHPYLLMSLGNQTGSGEEKNGVIRYKTSSLERTSGTKTVARPPTIDPKDVYQNIKDSEDCSRNVATTNNDKSEQIAAVSKENKTLDIIKENLNSFKSRYLMPAEEYDKLDSRVAKKIEANNDKIKAIDEGESVIVQCGEVPEPNSSHNFNNQKGAGYDKVRKHCQAHFDLMAYAFKYNHTRSATFYPGDWNSDKTLAKQRYGGNLPSLGSMHGAAGHGAINNPVTYLYHERLSEVINDLVNTLKKAGVYEDTMICVAGEFADQDGGGDAHRSDNSPWFIINSGASNKGHNLGKKEMLHIGDVHLAIMHRMGLTSKTQWGTSKFGNNSKLSNDYQASSRRGDTRLVNILKS